MKTFICPCSLQEDSKLINSKGKKNSLPIVVFGTFSLNGGPEGLT